MSAKTPRGPKPRPHPLLDAVRAELSLRSDKALADRLGYSWHQVAMTRLGRAVPSDEMILSIHEETGWPIARIKELADLPLPPRSPRRNYPEKFRRTQAPHPFVDRLRQVMGIKSDVELARRLGFVDNIFCKIRQGTMQVSDSILLSAHIESGIPIADLKALRVSAEKYRPTRGEKQTFRLYPLTRNKERKEFA